MTAKWPIWPEIRVTAATGVEYEGFHHRPVPDNKFAFMGQTLIKGRECRSVCVCSEEHPDMEELEKTMKIALQDLAEENNLFPRTKDADWYELPADFVPPPPSHPYTEEPPA